MTKEQLEAIFDRVRSWPAERQEDVARTLTEMEAAGTDVYILSPEEEADIENGLEEARRAEFASDEEMKALFERYKAK
jgi:hypothetical protein